MKKDVDYALRFKIEKTKYRKEKQKSYDKQFLAKSLDSFLKNGGKIKKIRTEKR